MHGTINIKLLVSSSVAEKFFNFFSDISTFDDYGNLSRNLGHEILREAEPHLRNADASD